MTASWGFTVVSKQKLVSLSQPLHRKGLFEIKAYFDWCFGCTQEHFPYRTAASIIKRTPWPSAGHWQTLPNTSIAWEGPRVSWILTRIDYNGDAWFIASSHFKQQDCLQPYHFHQDRNHPQNISHVHRPQILSRLRRSPQGRTPVERFFRN